MNRRTFLRVTGAALAASSVIAFENAKPIEDLTEFAVPEYPIRVLGFPPGTRITVLDADTHEVLVDEHGVEGNMVEVWGDTERNLTIIAQNRNYIPCRMDVRPDQPGAVNFIVDMVEDRNYV